MKAVVQRVTRASVTVGGEQISAIGRGICVLLGISVEDSQKELEHMVRKILNLRVFEDESGKHWSKSVMDKQYEVLCVSQFTLQCVLKGNKPDFHLAMPTEQAESFYNSFLEQLRKSYRPELVRDGKFGAYMQVHIQNDGPVTIELESPAPGAANSDPKQWPGKRSWTGAAVSPSESLWAVTAFIEHSNHTAVGEQDGWAGLFRSHMKLFSFVSAPLSLLTPSHTCSDENLPEYGAFLPQLQCIRENPVETTT
ncbi:D-aminoacyl-tRNA deacylase 1 [Arvicola amphibius]|uniref:D-aminoacyl-tRNA deacylase 1 n=1 Tax=Arvicola amphibius TaxID=1047088 RepID=UPI001C099AEA|nr:D-aminoacyl-tRNA deacylase 1 [Arvicola amphibius]